MCTFFNIAATAGRAIMICLTFKNMPHGLTPNMYSEHCTDVVSNVRSKSPDLPGLVSRSPVAIWR